MMIELVQDYADALAAMPAEHPRRRILSLLEEALRRDVHFIVRHPTMLFQCMWNNCWWYDCPEAAKHYQLLNGDTSPQDLPWNAPPEQRLSTWIERWRSEKAIAVPEHRWVHALRPPPLRIGAGLRAQLSGHTRGVWCLVDSPNGDRLASGSVDGTIRIWNPRSGEEISRVAVDGAREPICSLAWFRDGRLLALTGTGSIHIYDSASLSLLRSYRNQRDTLKGALSPDEQYLAVGCFDGTVRICDVEAGFELPPLTGHTDRVQSVAFSEDGTLLVTGSLDGTVRLWNPEKAVELQQIRIEPTVMPDSISIEFLLTKLSTGRSRGVGSVVMLDAGRCVAGGLFDHTVRIWDRSTGKEVARLAGHQQTVTHVTVSPDGRLLASGSFDGSVRLWNIDERKCVACWSVPQGEVLCVAFSNSGDHVACGLSDGRILLWGTAGDGVPQLQLHEHDSALLAAGFSPDGRKLVSGGCDTTAHVWDVETGLELQKLCDHSGQVIFVAFSPDGLRVVSQCMPPAASLQEDLLNFFLEAQKVGIKNIQPPDATQRSDTARTFVWEVATGRMLESFKTKELTDAPPVADETVNSRWVVDSDCRETRVCRSDSAETVAWFPECLNILAVDATGLVSAGHGRLHVSSTVNHLFVLRLESIAGQLSWYVRVNGQSSCEPISSREIGQLVTQGQLRQSDSVSRDGKTWHPASKLRGVTWPHSEK